MVLCQPVNSKWNIKLTGSVSTLHHDDTFSQLTLHHIDRFNLSTLHRGDTFRQLTLHHILTGAICQHCTTIIGSVCQHCTMVTHSANEHCTLLTDNNAVYCNNKFNLLAKLRHQLQMHVYCTLFQFSMLCAITYDFSV